MAAEQHPKPTARRVPPKLIDEGFVVFDVDGFSQLTPEQKLWRVDPPFPEADDCEVGAAPAVTTPASPRRRVINRPAPGRVIDQPPDDTPMYPVPFEQLPEWMKAQRRKPGPDAPPTAPGTSPSPPG